MSMYEQVQGIWLCYSDFKEFIEAWGNIHKVDGLERCFFCSEWRDGEPVMSSAEEGYIHKQEGLPRILIQLDSLKHRVYVKYGPDNWDLDENPMLDVVRKLRDATDPVKVVNYRGEEIILEDE